MDRDLASSLGVSVREASEALQLLWGGLDVARYNVKGKEYKVIAQLEREDRLVPDSLEDVYLRTAGGELVPASSMLIPQAAGLAQRHQPLRPPTRRHRLRPGPRHAARAAPSNGPRRMLADAPAAGCHLSLGWRGRRDQGGLDRIRRGCCCWRCWSIYMVLAAQFESLRHPFVIMLALPLALFGALGGLWLCGFVNSIALIKSYAPARSIARAGWPG